MDKHTNHQGRIYFMHLDVVRFFAAYMIVIFHLFYGWQANWGNPKFMTDAAGEMTWFGRLLETTIHNLSFGVDIFFLISGFLITYLLLREKDQHGKVNIGKFYFRRTLRIWPLYYLTVALGPILTYAVGEASPGSYIPHLLFVGNFELIQNGFSSVALNHLWSICIEEHFYFICPLIIAFIPVSRLPVAFWMIIITSFIYRGTILGQENYWMNMYLHTVSRMDVLAIGCMSAWYYYYGRLRFNLSKTTFAILALLFILLFTHDVYVFWDDLFLATGKKYTFVILAGILIGNLLFNEKLKLMPGKTGIWHYMGKVSYGIYMFNPIAVALFVKLYHAKGFQNGWVFFFGVHLLVIAMVVISFELYEKQFLKLKERFAVVKSRKF